MIIEEVSSSLNKRIVSSSAHLSEKLSGICLGKSLAKVVDDQISLFYYDYQRRRPFFSVADDSQESNLLLLFDAASSLFNDEYHLH